MGNVIVFLELSEGKLRSASLPAVTFAREAAQHHGGQVYGVVVGAGMATAEAAQYVAKLFAFDAPELKDYAAETYAPLLARVAREQGASVVCATATATGKDLLPRVSALLDCG